MPQSTHTSSHQPICSMINCPTVWLCCRLHLGPARRRCGGTKKPANRPANCAGARDTGSLHRDRLSGITRRLFLCRRISDHQGGDLASLARLWPMDLRASGPTLRLAENPVSRIEIRCGWSSCRSAAGAAQPGGSAGNSSAHIGAIRPSPPCGEWEGRRSCRGCSTSVRRADYWARSRASSQLPGVGS